MLSPPRSELISPSPPSRGTPEEAEWARVGLGLELGLGSSVGLDLELGSGLDAFEDGRGEEGTDYHTGEVEGEEVDEEDGSYYEEGEEGTYYEDGEGEEGMVRLDGLFEGMPLDVDKDEEGVVLEGEADKFTDVKSIYEKIEGLNDDSDNDFMVMNPERQGQIEIPSQTG